MSAWTCQQHGRGKDCSASSSNPMMEDAMGRRRGYWPVSTPPKQLVAHFEFEDGPFRVVGTVLIPNPLS
jgi:hypothetical protein